MSHKDPRVDAYIDRSADFAKPILQHLRKLVHAADPEVEETMKWSMPHFMHGGILCSMAAFKQHCTFGFWHGTTILGKDRSTGGAHGQFGRLTTLADLPAERVLTGYIQEAARLNDAGFRKSPPARARAGTKRKITAPPDLLAALRKNKKALAAFDSFTYSHKKEYVEWITGAKQDATRERRLTTAVQWIAAAKPRHWNYVSC